MGCQRKIAKKIVEDAHADYVLNLKANQETLLLEVENYFKDLNESGIIPKLKKYNEGQDKGKAFENESLQIIKTVEKGHGRIEKRTYIFSTDISWMVDAKKDWTGLAGLGMVEREVETNGSKTFETSYYIASIDKVSEFTNAVRSHWGVESMHYSLDVTFKDDANKTRKNQLPNHMAIMKRIAFNAFKSDKKMYPKESIKSKRLIAQCDVEYRDYLMGLVFELSQ